MDLITKIKTKKEYEISKKLFELLNDSLIFRMLFFGIVAKNLDTRGDIVEPTRVSDSDLVQKTEIKFDINSNDEYFLNMEHIKASIFAIGDFNKLYDDILDEPYDKRILPATLKIGSNLFIADYEDCIYYDYLYDHHYQQEIIEKMYKELPFYKFKGTCRYNEFIHIIKISYILDTFENCKYYSLTKAELNNMQELLDLILEKYPEYKERCEKISETLFYSF